jgi:conjugal transfer mating pair stabilization protein TraG
MAGYLAMSIPFLCIALVKGVGSFVQMASHLGNVSQGAASSAAGEVTSGNFSFGNIHEGNQQIANTNMLSQSMAATYRASSFQLSGGRTDMVTMGDGSQVANVSVPNLPLTLSIGETKSAQESQMASQSYQRAMNLSRSSSENFSSSGRQFVELSNRLNHAEQMSDGVNRGTHVDHSRTVNKSMQMIKDFANQHQIDEGKSAELLMNASFGNKGGSLNLFGGSIGGGIAVKASEQAIFTEAQKYAQTHDFQQAYRDTMQAASSISHTLSDEKSRSLADGMTESFEKGIQQRSEASKSFQQAESYSTQAMATQSNAASINANYTQEFFEWLSHQKADHTGGQVGKQGAAHIIANDRSLTLAYANRFMTEKGIVPQAKLEQSSSTLKQAYDQDTSHQVYQATKEGLQKLEQQAKPKFKPNLEQHGQDFRKNTTKQIDTTIMQNDSAAAFVKDDGQQVINKVQAQKGRSVVKRATAKAAKEIIGKSIYDSIFGESQEK